MEPNHQHRNSDKYSLFWQWLILAAAIAVLMAVVYWTARDFFILQRDGYIRPARHNHLMLFSHGSSPLTASQLRSWMTFSYINQQFRLPADYLKTSLKVTSRNYPDLSINSLASQQKKDPAVVLTTVQTAIENYGTKSRSAK